MLFETSLEYLSDRDKQFHVATHCEVLATAISFGLVLVSRGCLEVRDCLFSAKAKPRFLCTVRTGLIDAELFQFLRYNTLKRKAVHNDKLSRQTFPYYIKSPSGQRNTTNFPTSGLPNQPTQNTRVYRPPSRTFASNFFSVPSFY